MDVKKVILYIALAFVLMQLWNSWQREYGGVPAVSQTQSATSGASSIPQVPAEKIQQAAKAISVPQPAQAQGKMINVRTNVLDVAIDTHGGNVIRAQLLNYPVQLHSSQPVQILRPEADQLYVAQSGLLSDTGPDTNAGQAVYQSTLNQYTLASGQNELNVSLTWKNNQGVSVTKTFTFRRGQYDIGIHYTINNQSAQPWEGHFYAQLQRKKQQEESSIFYLHTYTGGSISSPDKPYQKVSYGDMDDANLNKVVQGGWLAFQQRYFLTAWAPAQTVTDHFYTQVNDQGVYTLGLISPTLTVAPRSELTHGAKLYVGPEIAENLKQVAPHMELTIDYGWLWMISVAIFWIMKKIYDVVGNWGWSIVLVTLFIKLLFYKLSEKSYRSMAKMRDLAPRLQTLRERLGDDKSKMGQATMELYRKEGVNPFGGCLPILVQIPFFIALYWVLIESVELRQAPFIFWIHDLAAKDPYYILPVLMGISMFVQQRLNPPPPDPTQAKLMMFLPVVFTVFFLNFPSGLVLYWLVNNVASGLQQWSIIKRYEKKKSAKKPEKGKKGE